MATPTKGETAEQAIKGIEQWLAVFGVPREILSDNGPAFRSDKWKEYLLGLGVKVLFSTPYHPQGNGRAEKTVGLITQAVRCVLNETGRGPNSWVEILHTAVRIVNANRNRSTRVSPYEAMLGGPSRMVEDNKAGLDWENGIPPEKAAEVARRAREPEKEDQLEGVSEEFSPGEEVLLKEQQGPYRKMRPLFKEGYVVVKRVGPVNYVIRNEKGQEKVYHREKLKKAGTRWSSPLLILPQNQSDNTVTHTEQPLTSGNGGGRDPYPTRERRPPNFYQAGNF